MLTPLVIYFYICFCCVIKSINIVRLDSPNQCIFMIVGLKFIFITFSSSLFRLFPSFEEECFLYSESQRTLPQSVLKRYSGSNLITYCHHVIFTIFQSRLGTISNGYFTVTYFRAKLLHFCRPSKYVKRMLLNVHSCACFIPATHTAMKKLNLK